MSYLGAYGDNDEVKLMPGKSRAGDYSERFSSVCLPDSGVIQGFLPTKNVRNPKLNPACLKGFGRIKPGKVKRLPYFEYFVPAGYPSSVDDPFISHLDLSAYLIRHPKTVYYFKVNGYSMVNAGISHKDLLVVDTAIKPKHRDVIIAVLNGEFTVKRLYLADSEIQLLSANPEFPAVTVTKETEFFVQGTVTTVIRTFNPLPYDNHFKDISYPHF